jgi:hypothetical protein
MTSLSSNFWLCEVLFLKNLNILKYNYYCIFQNKPELWVRRKLEMIIVIICI